MTTPEPFPGHVVAADDAPASPTGGPAGPTPAATVLSLRDAFDGVEVLLLRRRRGGAFSGMWVFPGGKVEEADAADAAGDPEAPRLRAAGLDAVLPEIAVARRAAVREAAEEAQLRLDVADLVVHSFWIPPPETPRRFSTWFFVSPAAAADTVVVDDAEVHEYRWMTPAAAFAQRDAGALALAPPTWMTLLQVGAHPSVAAVMAEAAGRPPIRFETRFGRSDRGTVTLWEGDAGYESGDLETPGPRRRLWVRDTAPWRVELSDGPAGPGPGA